MPYSEISFQIMIDNQRYNHDYKTGYTSNRCIRRVTVDAPAVASEVVSVRASTHFPRSNLQLDPDTDRFSSPEPKRPG